MKLKTSFGWSMAFIAMVGLAATAAWAQPQKWIDPMTAPHDLQIKGSEQPDLIPLALCYNVFFRTVAREAANGEEGYEKARALLLKTGVREESIDALLALAGDYETEVSAIEKEAGPHQKSYQMRRNDMTASALLALDEKRNSSAMALLGAAAQAIGGQEAQKVHDYIDQVVRRQVVIGGADAAIALNNRNCPACGRSPR